MRNKLPRLMSIIWRGSRAMKNSELNLRRDFDAHPRVQTDMYTRWNMMNALSMHYALGRNIHDRRFPSFAEWRINITWISIYSIGSQDLFVFINPLRLSVNANFLKKFFPPREREREGLFWLTKQFIFAEFTKEIASHCSA